MALDVNQGVRRGVPEVVAGQGELVAERQDRRHWVWWWLVFVYFDMITT